MAYPENTINDTGLKKVWDMIIAKLNLKVDKEAGKGLSTNDFTTTEKNKLSSIESGAEVNTVTSVAGKTGDVTLTKSDVGLGNVGNFKAVSTSANQGLTDTEKSNARANINAPSNGDIQSSKTLKSSVVTVNDAAPINAEDITVDITPVQDLHGYDRPWAGGAWKNKYIGSPSFEGCTNLNQWTKDSSTYNGHDVYYKSGTWNGAYKLIDLPVGTYTFSAMAKVSTASHVFCFLEASGSTTATVSEASSATYLQADTWARIRVTFEVTSAGTVAPRVETGTSGVTVYISEYQLEAGNQATSYADYSNECPIEGRTGAELDRVGKNWLPITATSQTVNGITFTVNNGIVSASGTATADVYFILFNANAQDSVVKSLAGKSLLLSGSPAGTPNTYHIAVNPWDGTQRVFQFDRDVAFNMPENPNGLRADIFIKSGQSVSNLVFKPMLRLASITDPTYEPYQGQQYTASFGETVHGGRWHVTDGGIDKTMQEVDLGSLNWEKHNTSAYWFRASLNGIKNAWAETANGICSQYSPSSGDAVYTGRADQSFGAGTDLIYIYDSTKVDMTAAEFKTAMDGVQLCYELATPTTISTPKQNVPMLKGINTVSADCGDTSLKYQPDNVIGELKGEIEDNIVYEDFKWTTNSSQSYSAGTPGTYGTSSWRDVKKEGYDVIGVTFVENRRFGDCILTLNYIPSTDHVEVIIFRATSSAVTIADEDIEYRVAYKKRT